MKYYVDKETCIGCGLCESICGDIFKLGDDGKAEAIADPDGGQAAAAAEAMESCPVAAIREN